MNTPYNTGKVEIGKYYQKPLRIEQDDDMIKVQGWLIGESKEARMNRIAKRIYFGLVLVLITVLLFSSNAKAAAIATMPNEGGGKIVLTDEVCKNDGKTYNNVKGITPVPSVIKQAGLPAAVNKNELFNIGDPDMVMFETFSENLKKKISSSPEWQKRNAPINSAPASTEFDSDPDSDIPF